MLRLALYLSGALRVNPYMLRYLSLRVDCCGMYESKKLRPPAAEADTPEGSLNPFENRSTHACSVVSESPTTFLPLRTPSVG